MIAMFSRRDFLSSGAAAASAMAQTRGPARKPNFVIFLADDLGCHDIGAWGATDLQTPHIDALAASGRKAEARAAYEEALSALDPKSPYRAFVQVKLDAVGGPAANASASASTPALPSPPAAVAKP